MQLPLTRKYGMRPLLNIISFEQFTLMSEGKESSFASYPWWTDCIYQVKFWICQDRTTTKDNLHEKAKNYALNYIANHPELSVNRYDTASEVADEVERSFQDKCLDQRPPAGVVARNDRERIPEQPENKYIKLSP